MERNQRVEYIQARIREGLAKVVLAENVRSYWDGLNNTGDAVEQAKEDVMGWVAELAAYAKEEKR